MRSTGTRAHATDLRRNVVSSLRSEDQKQGRDEARSPRESGRPSRLAAASARCSRSRTATCCGTRTRSSKGRRQCRTESFEPALKRGETEFNRIVKSLPQGTDAKRHWSGLSGLKAVLKALGDETTYATGSDLARQ